jgi:hypothetical protein
VESEAALVWAERRVELDPVATVDLELSVIILPDDPELDDSFRDRGNCQSSLIFWVLGEQSAVLERAHKL